MKVVSGSLAAAVVALLSFKIGAIILLLGARVIAEFERAGTPSSHPEGSGFPT